MRYPTTTPEPTEKLVVIKTLRDLEKLTEYVAGQDYVAYDTETDGVVKESRIIGFSVASEVTVGYYVILSYWDPETQKLVDLETQKGVKDFLGVLATKSLIMQNAPFDCFMTLNNYGIELMQSVVHDTMIGGHLLNENRSNGLKQRGVELFGEDATKEQYEMKASVAANGGVLTKEKYELYKADADLLAKYGAKDAILTLKVFYHDVPLLFEEKLDKFFYDEESMPLLRGPTYDMNSTGLRVDPDKLQKLKGSLQVECMEAKAFIYKEIEPYVKTKYKGTGKTNTFNIGSSQQLAWLLFFELDNEFNNLTKGGRVLAKAMGMEKMPYQGNEKREFIRLCYEHKDEVYEEPKFNPKTGKTSRPKKIGDPWKYMACGKESLGKLSAKYKWVQRLLEYKKNEKLLGTYVEGIEKRKSDYNIIRPSFLQHGTTSGRYSCKNPNFQNLPRDDKRVKACIIARQGKVFVGADYAQLEPRVFASISGDKRLQACFEKGEDFYSVIGVDIFDKHGCSLIKDDKNSFAKLHPKLRDISKIVSLSSAYGTTAWKMAPTIGKNVAEAQEIIDTYFERYPDVHNMMLESHEQVKKKGVVYNLFGRPRRMPEGLLIRKYYGNKKHADLPYAIRNILNLAMNHRVQSTGASIMNRAAIACWNKIKHLQSTDARWSEVKIVLQVHDELVLEGPEALKNDMVTVLKGAMEDTTQLPGVVLKAEPKIAYNLADLK